MSGLVRCGVGAGPRNRTVAAPQKFAERPRVAGAHDSGAERYPVCCVGCGGACRPIPPARAASARECPPCPPFDGYAATALQGAPDNDADGAAGTRRMVYGTGA